MHYLEPIFENEAGRAFYLKTSQEDSNCKIHLFIEDVSILMDVDEIKTLLLVVRSAQKGCRCKNCNCKASRVIKCKTTLAEVKFKLSVEQLVKLEELILGILFQEHYEHLLSSCEIS